MYTCTTLSDALVLMVVMGFASFCNDLIMPGAWAACMDIGGKYAGTVSGSMNMMGNLAGFVAPIVGGLMRDTRVRLEHLSVHDGRNLLSRRPLLAFHKSGHTNRRNRPLETVSWLMASQLPRGPYDHFRRAKPRKSSLRAGKSSTMTRRATRSGPGVLYSALPCAAADSADRDRRFDFR